MQREKMDNLLAVYRDGLLNDTIPFWQNHAPDREYGGFLFGLDADGTPIMTDKAMWIMGRVTWLFSRLYNQVEPKATWLELAKQGLDFLRRFGFDEDGRMFYAVTREGRPLQKRRYLFTETFAVIALAEYARAAQDDDARQQARDLYRLILKYHTTPGLLPPKTVPGTRPMKGHSMPMILLATSQVLRQVDDDPLYTQTIDNSLREIFDHFMHPEFEALLECVGPKGEFIDEPCGREVNPGHAIETAWFILEEARHCGNDADLIAQACRIIDWSLAIGWDEQYGGIYYFRDCKDKPCLQYEHDLKLWWPHCEAIYATLLAYHLTGEDKYAQWHAKVHDWAYSHFPDRKHGEWFGYLHRDGSVSCRAKGNMWKGPFHLPRMQLNCWKLLEEM